jgi:hypothetical protein
MSLNEKLAVEVMGALKGGSVEYSLATGVPTRRATYAYGGKVIDQKDWNPTTDLNQLRECYLAAEDSWNSHNNTPFRVVFAESMKPLLKESFGDDFIDWDTLLLLWVKHPELVAQAILKAKGVEV